jgi:hypothetical protein
MFNNTVHEYLLKVRQGNDAGLARKAVAVLKEIARYTGKTYGNATPAQLPIV